MKLEQVQTAFVNRAGDLLLGRINKHTHFYDQGWEAASDGRGGFERDPARTTIVKDKAQRVSPSLSGGDSIRQVRYSANFDLYRHPLRTAFHLFTRPTTPFVTAARPPGRSAGNSCSHSDR